MMHDLKYAFRTLVHQPVFSVVALLTLALGIGANTAIFSLVKGVLLDALPYNDSEELVVAWERKPEGGTEVVSPPTFLDWKDPIGKIIDNPHGKAEVVGVVSDVHHYGLDVDARPELYLAYSQNVFAGMSLVIRTTSPPEALAAEVRQAVWTVDEDQAIHDISTMEQAISRWVFLPRLSATLLAAFAGAALFLAAVGIYGVIACSVSQRTTEMGLRMALGASGVDLVRLVVRNSMTLVGLGMAFGLIAALGLTRFLSGQLYGVGTLDPAVFVSVAVVLGLAAFVASYLPARRATRVDPLEALRVE